ncbi:MAG: fumarylacetoacetate hydrolase family protein [Acidimicrobiaceae bacterium]|nr:fumarylacetoacetate hydrolase family protein [Acidimicrobiaceae bacterium]MCY4176146.1 fumarylacetoacetate hydrolase family protein [Acidimicrobiaceae bacterium]MCY4294349.1 fumarylacetoacetate hydrolase family protein [Acidimicrobiaceae bacterium]
MRLLSYSVDGKASFGALDTDGTGVIDLAARLDGVADLSDLLAQGRLDEARKAARDASRDAAGADHTLEAITFERLLPKPPKIFCIGVNYGGRASEHADDHADAYPSVFVRFPETLVGHGQALLRPPESQQLDYEGEIVAVIGTGGRRIAPEDARSHIAGLSLGNEGTVRDWVRHGRFNVTQGKNWHHSGSLGPWLVTLDEIGDLAGLRLNTRVNGDSRQDDRVANMAFGIEYQIHYLSTFIGLQAGDVIFTGTPTGAGARLDPPVWLKPGDIVEVTVPEIGTLRNPVRDEAAP